MKYLMIISMLMGAAAFAVDDSANDTFPKPQAAGSKWSQTHIGAVVGYGDINGPAKGAFQYGLDAGYQPVIPFGLGLQVTYFKTTVSGIDYGRLAILPRVTYNFGGNMTIIEHSYIGLKAGVVVDSPEGVDSMTRFALAPALGFDIPVSDSWTFGTELSYLFVMGPESNNDSLSALAVIKYWF